MFQSAASDLATNDLNRVTGLFAFNLYAAGMIANFYVQVTAGTPSNPYPTLTWPVLSGKTYQVLFKNNLTDPVWQTVPGMVTILGGTGYFTDFAPVTGQKFYQITGQ
jgi:hypothetical protein